MSDVPADSSVISIADKFLKQYGVEVTAYGAPEVQKDWMTYAEQSVGGDVWDTRHAHGYLPSFNKWGGNI